MGHTVKATTSVEITDIEAHQLTLRIMRNLFKWPDTMSIVDGNVIREETCRTSHSFTQRSVIREATAEDHFVSSTISKILGRC